MIKAEYMSESKKKQKKKHHNYFKKRYGIFALVVLIILIILTVSIYFYSGTEAAAKIKARRIAREYMRKEYGVTLEADDVSESVFKRIDYNVIYRLSSTSTVYVGVSLEKEEVVYDNYVEAYIFDKINQRYREEVETIWDYQAEIEIDGNIIYPEDKFLSKDKKIDYERAMRSEDFELQIITRTYNLEQSANAIYNSMVYFKQSDIKLERILYYDFSGDTMEDEKIYILEDLDQFKDAATVLDYLENYKE